MSRYIRLLNSIKANIATLPLTPSQMACRARIGERLAYPGIVNLYGLPGTGKTVLGWALSGGEHGAFIVNPIRLASNALPTKGIVFVDNAEADRGAFRRLLGELESAGVQRAIVVTRTPADDYVFRAELNLTDADIAVVLRNLRGLGFPTDEARFSTLWHIVLQAAKEG